MSDKDETDEPKHEKQKSPISARKAKKLTKLKEYLSKQESLKNARKVSGILKKNENERTEEEKTVLAKNEVIVRRIHKNKERRLLSEQRILETEDDDQVLQHKCWQLAQEILQSKQTVIYTGAGISTAASIPDYRGPQGVWTLLQKGEQLIPQDLSDAEPTLTHMCITALQKKGHVTHVVSQNCDGLHLRSGLPRKSLSEVHGNMFIEICYTCKPHREYIRLFDVTENTGVRKHQTGRICKKCGGKLKDTIVHFGEKSGLKSPYRWKEAVRAANNCDLILCLGSSLKILKKYSCLWCMDRARNKRPKLVIVNLQWTPKDSDSFLKINGRCDDVLQRVMKLLRYDIPSYSRDSDPIFQDAIALEESEQHSTTKKILERPHSLKNIPMKTVPRSRTPSVSSSDSDSSDMSDTSSDSSDITESDTDDEQEQVNNKSASYLNSIKLEQFTAYANCKQGAQNVPQKLDISSIISKVKGRIQPERDKIDNRQMSQEEKFMLKSEKICNEAKRAMQIKNETAERDNVDDRQMSQEEKFMLKSEMICNEAKGAMQLKNETTVNDININTNAYPSQFSQNENQYLNSKNGFYDNKTNDWTKKLPSVLEHVPSNMAGNNESIGSYEEKLRYLQTLQSQLQALKQTQQILKERESSHNDGVMPVFSVDYGSNQISPKNHSTLQKQSMAVNWLVDGNCKIGVQNTTNQESSLNEVNVDPHVLAGYNPMCNILTKDQLEEYACQEQKACTDMIEEQQRKFEKEKADMKRGQENEHRRIYQQFVMQLQVAEQTMRGEKKKAEMKQVFLVQQQILLNKQTNQLQELFRKHQAEQKVLTDMLEKRQKEWEAFVQSVTVTSPRGNMARSGGSQPQSDSYLSHNSTSNPNYSQLPLSVLQPPGQSHIKVEALASPQAVFSQRTPPGMFRDNLSSNEKFTSNLNNERILNKDVGQQLHSDQLHRERYRSENDQTPMIVITSEEKQSYTGTPSLYEGNTDKNNGQKETKIPGFNELVQGIISCDSCAFLKDYGMSKRRCSKCDSLKMKYGLVDKSSSNPFSGYCPTQVGHMTSIKEHGSSISVSSSAEAACNSNLTSQYFGGGNPDISYIMTSSSHNYLNTAQVIDKVSKLPCSNLNSVPVIDSCSSHDYPCQTPTTSSVSTVQLDCPNNSDQELSPVIPYASPAMSNPSPSVISHTTISISADESSLAKETNISNDTSLFVNESIHVNTLKNVLKTEKVNCVDKQTKAEVTAESLDQYDTPFRPRSQSDFVHMNESVMADVAEKRQIRSHSHGELLVMEEKDGAENTSEMKEKEVTAAKIGKKRKSAATVSVPGWFGKGLNLKKKRK